MSGSSLDSTAQTEVDPLVGIDAKTSWYPTARSWSRSRRRILGYKGLEANHYHVMSRTCGGAVFFDDTEKEALRRLIWRVAEFCGVEVLTYCVMGNHFHLLVRVPHHEAYLERFDGPEGEKRLLSHLRVLYSKAYVEQLEADIRQWRRLDQETAVQVKLQGYKDRMADLSRLVKEIKERFSRWYNKRHERRGTLWMDRFKSVLIESTLHAKNDEPPTTDVVRAMATYIDLNPVRAGLEASARDYPWCGYGEAMGAGTRKARRALCRVVERPVDAWETQDVAEVYGRMLQSQNAFSVPSPEPAAVTEGSAPEPPDALTIFREAVVLGSQAFVEETLGDRWRSRSCELMGRLGTVFSVGRRRARAPDGS
ncbi:MAG: transposase [Verrucomicrobiales bacterium]|nr:transposase [Verrucomicrobiales bacterium]